MKNIEKIAIDTILKEFSESKRELIEQMISAKQAVQVAQTNFKKSADPVINYAKDTAASLLQDDISEDAVTYFDNGIS